MCEECDESCSLASRMHLADGQRFRWNSREKKCAPDSSALVMEEGLDTMAANSCQVHGKMS
jgi:hypothetical protein